MATGKEKSPRFEDAVAEIESIIDRIESGEIGLEECIAQYERGMKLAGRCRAILDTVQKRITELTADSAGKLASPDGAPDEDHETQDPSDEQ